MPHATSMPSPGFQALILCGPGVSLTTFTANPEDFPKALVPIANRPMIWYPLDWCYRMGITSKRYILTAVRLHEYCPDFLEYLYLYLVSYIKQKKKTPLDFTLYPHFHLARANIPRSQAPQKRLHSFS